MYSQKKAAVRIHYMNLHERSSREPTRKETTEENWKKKKKKVANTCIFFQTHTFSFQHLQTNTKFFFTFQMYSISQNLHL